MASSSSESEDEHVLLYILLLRRHHRRERAACRTMWTRSWIDWRQRQGVYANLLKELDTEDPETHVYVRVYVGCTSCEYGNMGVCCVCLRVCICEPVLTIVFLRVDERSCVHGYAHKYY